jgi:acyl carrier protein
MTQQEILEKITPIFQDVFNDDEMVVNMELTSDDINEWSSISQVLLITELEEAFDIKFKLMDVAVMNDVKTIVNLISEKVSLI